MPDHDTANADYWRRKLAAFLHDSPDKVLSIVDHEDRARRIAGENWVPEEIGRKEADWGASAADRLPFPPSSQTLTPLSCFKHPLGGTHSTILLDEKRLPIGISEEISQKTRPVLDDTDPRLAFFATWRFWRNWASSCHRDFALYPAETRLPDHTIWNHLAVTSAMQGCLGGSFKDWLEARRVGLPAPPTPDRPCFLIFTIGPVQDFIAAARSTRDLWSGSYLLSYLIATVLRQIALDFGPDHLIFPNLCDQPLIDLLLKDEIWDKARTHQGQDLFQAFDYYDDSQSRQRLLTPTLPNRFLAVLPSKMAEHQHRGPEFVSAEAYAQHLADSLRRFLVEEIATEIEKIATETLASRFDATRFRLQAERLLEVHWQLLPWPDTFADAEKLAQSLPPDDDQAQYTPRAGLRTIRHLCQHGADARYLTDGAPKNVAAAWSALYSLTEWCLDGAKANRAFQPQQGSHDLPTKLNTKDSINGRDEAVLILEGEDDAAKLSAALKDKLKKDRLVKAGEALAAASLIKRLWPFVCLRKWHRLDLDDFAMPNTHSMAAHQPWADSDEDETPTDAADKHFAILALDGDEMGKWISGSKTPFLDEVLSLECKTAYTRADAGLAAHRRPLSPSWHLQFSEALANFSLHAVRCIVEAHDGRLIYSGGDDVLAMLPADRALACAEALRLAFRGDPALNTKARGLVKRSGKRETWRSDNETPLFAIQTPGFLQLAENASTRQGDQAALLDDPVRFPVIVPGPQTDVSVGIAIAHYKAPLQDIVRAAQDAEKRAKGALGRGAVAVSLFKRSGEITHWGCRWESGGIKLYQAILDAMADGSISAKFPHRVCDLLAPYLSETATLAVQSLEPIADFPVVEILDREFRHALVRQGLAKNAESFKALEKLVGGSAQGPESLLNHYVGEVRNAAEQKLQKAKADPLRWQTISGAERRKLEIAPSEAPLAALIGLCSTAAFAHRTRSKD